jgi:hypothetical protein
MTGVGGLGGVFPLKNTFYTPPGGSNIGGVLQKNRGGLTPPRGGLRKLLEPIYDLINNVCRRSSNSG